MNEFNKIVKTLRWVRDLTEGEMIESPDYTEDYMGFNTVTEDDLNFICTVVNVILLYFKYEGRIYWVAGEISYTVDPKQVKTVDGDLLKDLIKYCKII